MVIDYSTKNNFHLAGTETIPAENIFMVLQNNEEVGITNPDQQICRRMSVVLPKTGLGKAGDAFGLMENATMKHNNFNGGIVNLERSVNSLKSFKSISNCPIRHSKFSEVCSDFFVNDSRCRNLVFNNRRLSFGYREPTFKGWKLGPRHRKPKFNDREMCSRGSEMLSLCRETISPCRETLSRHGKSALLHREAILRLLDLGFRHHSFTGMDCLSVHCKNFILHVQDINTLRPVLQTLPKLKNFGKVNSTTSEFFPTSEFWRM